MDYDAILQQVGQMGPYQIVMLILLGLCTFYNALQTLGVNIIAPHHDHTCDVTEGKGGFTYFEQLQVAPLVSDTGATESCRMLDLDWTNTTLEEVSSWNRSELATHPTVACSKWVFNSEQYTNTFTSEWSAVCGDAWLRQIFTNTYQGGLLVGSIISGQVADRIGRKNTLVISNFLNVVLGVACVFNLEMISFLILRFFFAITIRGCELTSFVLISELLSSQWTAFAGIIVMFIFTLGGLAVSGIGFAISDFRWLQLVLLPMPLLMISYYFIVPESPKWLVTKGRHKEVEQTFRKMAKFNRKPYPESAVGQYLKQAAAQSEAQTPQKKDVSITRILRADLRKTTLIVTIDWIALMLIYAAFTMSMNELAGSIYINIVIACVLEIPGYIASLFVIRRFGRKWPVVIAFGLAALMNLTAVPLQLYPDLSRAVTILSLVCRAFLSSIYGMFYIYGALLFPVEVRQIALGTAIAIGSAFGLAAPYIAGPVANIWTPLPSLIFSTFAVVASIATVFLPDLQPSEPSAAGQLSGEGHSASEETSIPITSSAYRPAASCVPTDHIYPLTNIQAAEEVAGDDFKKQNVLGTHFKGNGIAQADLEESYVNKAFIDEGYI